MILDTSVLIDLLRGNREVVEKIRSLENRHVTLSLTTVSVFELWQGTDEVNEKKRERLHFLLESIASFSLDTNAAKEAGKIHAALRKEGRIIDLEDSMIAGIAKVKQEPLLTRNTDHFGRINGLIIETY